MSAFSFVCLPLQLSAPFVCNFSFQLHLFVKLYLIGLRSYCVDLGIPDLSVFEDPHLQRNLRGIKTFHAARTRERRPITGTYCYA